MSTPDLEQQPERTTQAGLARLLGDVSRQAIHDLCKRGILRVDPFGLIDVAEARAAIAAMVHPVGKTHAAITDKADTSSSSDAPAGKAEEKGEAWQAVRLRREMAEAAKAELDLAERQGKLMAVEDVRALLVPLLSAIGSAIDQVAPRLVSIVTPETNGAANFLHIELEMDRMRQLTVQLATQAIARLGGGESVPAGLEPRAPDLLEDAQLLEQVPDAAQLLEAAQFDAGGLELEAARDEGAAG